MADEHEDSPGGIPRLMQDFMAQLHGITERLEGLTRVGESLPALPALPSALPGLRNLPMPGALSAAQLNSIATSVAAQRRSIEALKTQLTAFDEQLAVLERLLGPLAEWSRAWAELEERLTRRGRAREKGAGDT